MKRSLVVLILIIALVTVALPAAFAEQSSPVAPEASNRPTNRTECTVDLTGETVLFYHIGDLSGAYRGITQPLLAGFDDAMKYFNANGGLCGATIAHELGVSYDDTAGSQEKAQEVWDRFVTDADVRPPVVLMYNSADGEILRDQAAELQTPILLAAGSDKALYGEDGTPGWEFALIPLYTDQLGLFCEYISENWADFGIDGDPSIGHLSWGIPFGQSSDTAETRAYCESVGVSYAGAEYFSPLGTPDVGPQLKNLTDNGANIIYTTTLATGADTVIKAVAGAGLLDSVVVSGTNWILDTSVYGLAGADSNGVVGNLPYVWWDDLENEGVQIVNAQWVENRLAPAGGDAELQAAALRNRNIAYLTAYSALDLWMEVYTRAINEVGFENVTGEVFYNILTNDFEYETFHGLANIAYDAENRSVRNSQIGQIQIEEGALPKIVPISDVYETPDLRPGGADVVAE